MKYLPLYGFLLLVASSCSKYENATDENVAKNKLDKIDAGKVTAFSPGDPNDIMAFYSFSATPVNGTFGLKCYSTHASLLPPNPSSPYPNNDNIFSGAFYDANDNIIPGGVVTFGKINFLPNPQNGYFYDMTSAVPSPAAGPRDHLGSYASMEGTTQTIQIDPTPGGSSRTGARGANTNIVSGSLYIPSKALLRPGLMQRELLGSNYFFKMFSPMYGGTYDIYWWPDNNNDKGVVISVEYDAEFSSQFHASSPVTTSKVYRAFRVPDNGKYTLKFSDIADMFPNANPPYNAVVVLTIGRASYSILSSGDGLQKYAVYAATATETALNINVLGFTHQ